MGAALCTVSGVRGRPVPSILVSRETERTESAWHVLWMSGDQEREVASSTYAGGDREMDGPKQEGPAMETGREVDLAGDKQADGRVARVTRK